MKKRYFLLAYLTLALLATALFNGCQSHQEQPLAANGILDLTNWEFEKNGSVRLDGKWEFFWQQLLAPSDFANNSAPARTAWFTIPGRWDGYSLDDQRLGGDGFATFRLRVKLATDEAPKAIRILNQSSAYTLWVNGQVIARNGVVGTSHATTTPQYLLQEPSLPPHGDHLEIILQVANFNHRKGGVWNPILLGTEEQIKRRHAVQWIFDLFLFGCLIIMGVYHFCLYLQRRKDPSLVYFTFFCLGIGLRIIVRGDRYITVLFPDFPWEWLYRIEMLTVTVSLSMLVLFIQSLFNRYAPRIIFTAFISLEGLVSLIILTMPARLSSLAVTPNIVFILLVFMAIMVTLIRSIRDKNVSAGIILGGFVCLFATLFNDILTVNDAIYTVDLVPLGVFLMILSQSYVLSLRFSRAFASVEKLSRELEEKNIALTRLDRLKDEFLAKTSHELRTPLTGIIGLSEALIGGIAGQLPAKAVANLGMVSAGARRLAHLINDILDIAKLKNSDIEVKQEPVEITTVARTVLALTEPLAAGRPLRLIDKIPDKIGWVVGDEDRIQQILFNLLGNAVKFTSQGEVALSALRFNGMVEVTVTDSGPGIPADQQEVIFQSFAQGDATETRQHGGTGLGLAITRHLVQLHGGTIRVESQPGEGAIFTFSLPACEPPAADHEPAARKVAAVALPEPQPTVEPAPARIPYAEAPRILVVDDDPVNLQVVDDHLALEKMNVLTAADGTRALEILEQEPLPDLILLDLMMPGMSGYEVCEKIRANHDPSRLPIILLTARNRVSDLVRGFDAGANDYLTKPFARDELVARVSTHLKIKQAYLTLAENLRLKRELQDRQRTEQELRCMQRRLSGMLNSVEDAILALNENGEVCFCNRLLGARLGDTAGELLGQPMDHIFSHDTVRRLRPWLAGDGSKDNHRGGQNRTIPLSMRLHNGSTIACHAHPIELELDEEHLLILIMPPEKTAAEKSRDFIQLLNRQRKKLQSMESALSELTPQLLTGNPDLEQDLQALEKAMAQIGRDLEASVPFDDKRALAVALMTASVTCWCNATGDTKGDLAATSRLWSVYVNHHGNQRTQTLDRYLDIETLPRYPRWQQVIQTAEFVLECPNLDAGDQEQLESLLIRFCQM